MQALTDPLRVAVLTADPLDLAGMTDLIGRQSGMTHAPHDPQVLVVAAPAVTAGLLGQIRQLSPRREIPVAMVLERFGEADLLTSVETGLRGLIWRHRLTTRRFLALVRTVGTGGSDLPRDMQARLIDDVLLLQQHVLAPRGLTASGFARREVEVLGHIADGLDSAEIAQLMHCSERTVKGIVSALMARRGLRNRPEAVALALRSGLLG
ncbi:response regulator transcription factor [Kineosporia sp. J2-2]|uniref:Response regulator transcription factor n=1 Tax=Kineosporia corallincola TaxID=2835133 RepID=A0ABS5TN83_9ACTN|nr:LuxR C-terminal-related transcriptional regulator [Kineosporia corallincola]MBT0772298.1 response regulator transcription factor [Kineosporia corallincola]